MPGPRPAVLTYHSQNIGGHDTADNDHVALRKDLEALHLAGMRVIGLPALLDWLDGRGGDTTVDRAVCLSFDDGCDFDTRDLDYPGHGTQRSFLGILQDFILRHGPGAQPGLHATSFVIASARARQIIDRRSLFGRGWMNDDWWSEAIATGLLSIGNHSWDHAHPDLEEPPSRVAGFAAVDNRDLSEAQVVRAAQYIERKTGVWPEFFAYPCGESSRFIRESFFPGLGDLHRCRAAFGTAPGPLRPDSERWNLPRYVCGRDWTSPDGLLEILNP